MRASKCLMAVTSHVSASQNRSMPAWPPLNGTDRPFDGVGIQFDAAIGEEQDQAIPIFGNVFQGLAVGDLAVTRARFWASQISKAAMMGFERSCRAARR